MTTCDCPQQSLIHQALWNVVVCTTILYLMVKCKFSGICWKVWCFRQRVDISCQLGGIGDGVDLHFWFDFEVSALPILGIQHLPICMEGAMGYVLASNSQHWMSLRWNLQWQCFSTLSWIACHGGIPDELRLLLVRWPESGLCRQGKMEVLALKHISSNLQFLTLLQHGRFAQDDTSGAPDEPFFESWDFWGSHNNVCLLDSMSPMVISAPAYLPLFKFFLPTIPLHWSLFPMDTANRRHVIPLHWHRRWMDRDAHILLGGHICGLREGKFCHHNATF